MEWVTLPMLIWARSLFDNCHLHIHTLDISQRINLVSHTSRRNGDIPVYDVPGPLQAVGAPLDTPLSQLNSDLVDVAFVDEAIQCDPPVCKEIGRDYKFGGRRIWSLISFGEYRQYRLPRWPYYQSLSHPALRDSICPS